MSRRELGAFEFKILRALMVLDKSERYGAGIREWLRTEGDGGPDPNPGAILVALRRLEGKDFVEGSWGEPIPEPGGKARRYYEIKPLGRVAVQRTEESFAPRIAGFPAPGVA